MGKAPMNLEAIFDKERPVKRRTKDPSLVMKAIFSWESGQHK